MTSALPIKRLEAYSLEHPNELLLVEAEVEGETDEVMVFRGFSSSLVRSTDYDPDVPLLPEGAEIVAIARLRGPYQPENPQYLDQNLTWEDFSARFLSNRET